MSNKQKRLTARLVRMLDDYRNPYHMAMDKGDCPTLVYRCLDGGFSPTLFKKYIRPEPRKRTRFIADVEQSLIVRIDAICADAGITRSELLAWWASNHEEFLMFFHGPDDYAELEY